MASPATAAFLSAWRKYNRTGHALVKVALTDPSSLTLRLAGAELATTDGTWEVALADVGPVIEPGDFLSTDVDLCTFSFKLLGSRRLSAQTSGTIASLFSSYRWHGATVTVYLWETTSLATFATDAFQIFKGTVVNFQQVGTLIDVICQQRLDWNRELPTTQVTRAKYPRAPEASIGQAIPLVYGKHRDVPARLGTSWSNAFQHGMISVAGGQRGVKGVVALAGRGSAGGVTDGEKGLVLFAGHACKTFNDETAGCTPLLEHGGKLCDLDPIGGDVVNSAAAGTGFKITDITSGGTDPFTVFFPVLPIDAKRAASNNAENPRAVLDALNETSYMVLDYDNSKRDIYFQIPDLPPPGALREVRAVYAYETSAGAANVRLLITTGATTQNITLAASTTPTAAASSMGTAWNTSAMPVEPWQFSLTTFRFTFNGVATGETAKIYYFGLSILVRPDWPVVIPGKTVMVPIPDKESTQWVNRRFGQQVFPRNVPPVNQVDSAYFATLDGYADSGGTYTGSGTDLIERAADIGHHLLVEQLSQTGLVETGASTPGSLVLLRDSLKTWRRQDMISAIAVSDFKPARDVLEIVAQSFLGLFYLSRFTDKWHGVPWVAGRSVNYDLTLTKFDITDPEGPRCTIGVDDVCNDLEVRYSPDDWSRRLIHSTFVSYDRSSSGHFFRALRDEDLTVVASVNDRINFTDSGARTATLTAAAYATGGALASHAQTQMRAVAAGGRVPFISYGFEVNTSNNKIDFDEGGTPLVATLASGTYTGAELATEVARALNDAGALTYSCSYSDSTRKFTISAAGTGGTDTYNFSAAGPNHLVSAAVLLGFAFADVASASATGDNEVEAEKFYFACSGGSLVLNYETGADGIDAATPRCAGYLFGHDMTRDPTATTWLAPHSPKSHREQTCQTSATRYGRRRRRSWDLRGVHDSETAREVRNRLIDLLAEPRVRIAFRSERIPDMERGRVFSFDSSMDDVKAYPGPGTDGSWAGKKFMAYRVIQNLSPVFETEVEAVEIS